MTWTFEPQTGPVKVELYGQTQASISQTGPIAYEWKVVADSASIGASGPGGMTITFPEGNRIHKVRVTNVNAPSVSDVTPEFRTGIDDKKRSGTQPDKYVPPEESKPGE